MSNEINFTPEMLEQAKSAPSAAALLILAQENGITMTAKKAATYYARFHPETGAISDEELDNVSAGCGGTKDSDKQSFNSCTLNYSCTWCSKSWAAHMLEDSCSQYPLNCSTCNNFKEGQCILEMH
ncbi:MAG: hypothetical protein RSE05_09890 [Clostridium sp.]